MTEIIRGRLIAQNIREKVAKRIQKLDHPPGLAAILVGDDEASHLYVALKEKAAKEVGIYFEKILFPSEAKEKTIIQKVQELNNRPDINGILVQLPLPAHNEDAVISAIDPDKDVDGFHPVSRDRLKKNIPGLVPPVALAILRLIQATHQPLRGKQAVIVSNNEIFAQPLIELLLEAGIEGKFLSRQETALTAKLNVADIIIVAVGEAGFVTNEMVKEGAIVIDVGTNKTEDGRLVGDVAPSVKNIAAFKSPVPGGVGPLTVAYLLQNVLKATLMQRRK